MSVLQNSPVSIGPQLHQQVSVPDRGTYGCQLIGSSHRFQFRNSALKKATDAPWTDLKGGRDKWRLCATPSRLRGCQLQMRSELWPRRQEKNGGTIFFWCLCFQRLLIICQESFDIFAAGWLFLLLITPKPRTEGPGTLEDGNLNI